MPRGRKDNPAAAVVVSPSRNRFRSPTLVLQAIEILGLEKNVFAVLVVVDVMLLVVDDEVGDALRDRGARVHYAHLERPKRRWSQIEAARKVSCRCHGQAS